MKARQAALPGLAALAVAALLAAGTSISLIAFLGAVMVVALCIWLVLGVMSAASRVHRLRIFRSGSWLRLVAGGHLLRMAVAVPLSLWAALWIVVALVAQPARTAAGAVLVATLVPLVGRLAGRVIDREVIAAQRLRILLPPVIAMVGGAVLVVSLLLPHAPPETLGEGVARAVHYTGTSALLGQVFDLYALSAGVTDLLRGAGWRAIVLGLLFEGSQWFGLASALALLLIPPRELLRILQPEGRPGTLAFALSGVVLTAMALVLVEGAASLEAQARALTREQDGATADTGPATGERSTLAEYTPAAIRARVETERLGDLYCPLGTVAQFAANQEQIESQVPQFRGRIETAARQGFDQVRDNVPVFLDAYYSLSAEYLRTWNLLAGSTEDNLRKMITDHLEAGDPFAPASEIMAASEAKLPPLFSARQALLDRCSPAPPDEGEDSDLVVTASMPLADLALPDFSGRNRFAQTIGSRGISLGVGIGGAIIGSIGGKIATGAVFKAAATTLAKIAGGRLAAALAGAGAGAAGGAAVGSIVPGAGTALGAAAGGAALFVGGWFASDYTLLKIEERLRRAEFEAVILAAIDATEAEFIATLTGGAP